jgi:hypothetical protein
LRVIRRIIVSGQPGITLNRKKSFVI